MIYAYHFKMPSKVTHGGKRRNSGRKTEVSSEAMSRRTMTLDPMTIRKLTVVGDGNISKGVRIAAQLAFEAYQNGKLPG